MKTTTPMIPHYFMTSSTSIFFDGDLRIRLILVLRSHLMSTGVCVCVCVCVHGTEERQDESVSQNIYISHTNKATFIQTYVHTYYTYTQSYIHTNTYQFI